MAAVKNQSHVLSGLGWDRLEGEVLLRGGEVLLRDGDGRLLDGDKGLLGLLQDEVVGLEDLFGGENTSSFHVEDQRSLI
jgi:hypothetical protein